MGGGGVLGQGGDDSGIGEKISRIGAFEGAGLNVKDVDEDTHVAEGLRFLGCEVGLGEGVLSISCLRVSQYPALQVSYKETHVGLQGLSIPSTVPKIEYKTPQELDSAVLNIYGCAQATNIFGDIVAKDDATHGRLPRSRLTH